MEQSAFNFVTMPIPLDNLDFMYWICCFQFSLLSIRVPRYLVADFSVTGKLLIKMFIDFFMLQREKIRKFDFPTFKLSLFAASQSETLCSSVLSMFSVSALDLSEYKTVVSSANRRTRLYHLCIVKIVKDLIHFPVEHHI